VNRSIRIVRQLEQLFQPYRMMFKGLKRRREGKKETAFIVMFLGEKRKREILKLWGGGGGQLFGGFSLRILKPHFLEKRGMSVPEDGECSFLCTV
jgi:hypothetical protein